MTERYLTVAAPATVELETRKSRFIGTAVPINSPAAAEEALAAVRARHPAATHHAFAYLLASRPDRAGMVLARQSDGGEPSGTAGRPIMTALERRGRLDTCCIVTRYFGGILLGAPGLVRAYGAAAARALDAAGSRTVVRAHLYRWTVPYESYGATARFLQAFPEAVVKDADFGAEVQVTFTVAAAQAERLRREAGRLLQAQPRLVLVGETYV